MDKELKEKYGPQAHVIVNDKCYVDSAAARAIDEKYNLTEDKVSFKGKNSDNSPRVELTLDVSIRQEIMQRDGLSLAGRSVHYTMPSAQIKP